MLKHTMRMMAGIALAAVVAGVVSAGLSGQAVGQAGDDPVAPRYADTCPHGHNGFDCDASSYRSDITELQERVAALESER
jgi:hypothetical protein